MTQMPVYAFGGHVTSYFDGSAPITASLGTPESPYATVALLRLDHRQALLLASMMRDAVGDCKRCEQHGSGTPHMTRCVGEGCMTTHALPPGSSWACPEHQHHLTGGSR